MPGGESELCRLAALMKLAGAGRPEQCGWGVLGAQRRPQVGVLGQEGSQGHEGAGVLGRLGCGRARGWGGGDWGLPQGQEGKGGYLEAWEGGAGEAEGGGARGSWALSPGTGGDRRSVHVGVWGLQEPARAQLL